MRRDVELLKGAVDFHVHAGPSLFPRLLDALEATREAAKVGMRGIVIKHHHVPTVDRAYFAHRAVPEAEVFGGITLNYSAGGLNPFAVDSSLRLGGKVVWMPTVDAKNHLHHFGELGKYGSRLDYEKPKLYDETSGITILGKDGSIKPNLELILDLVAEADALIATSHLDLKESKALVEEAKRRGVKKILATHAFFTTTSLNLEAQKWMAEKGAYMEICYSSLSPAWRSTSIEDVVKVVREVGPEHYVLSSDLGQVHNPPPPEGMRIYITLLLEKGFEPDEIRTMVKHNPEKLLGLNPDDPTL